MSDNFVLVLRFLPYTQPLVLHILTLSHGFRYPSTLPDYSCISTLYPPSPIEFLYPVDFSY